MSIVTVLRLASGLAMVAGGVILCTPLASDIAAALGPHRPRTAERLQPPPTLPDPVPQPGLVAGPAAWQAKDPDASLPAGLGMADPAIVPPEAAWPHGDAPPVRSAYVPPTPPPALSAAAPAAPVPEVDSTYRSMLDMPPPELLDARRPPQAAVAFSAQPRPTPPARPLPDALVPASIVVRDGDDLEGIATRYYGHPAAAGAIWGANRERIPDPRLLPIGIELRLPPPWTIVPAGGDAATGSAPAVEPAGGGLGALAAPAAGTFTPGPLGEAPAPWLVRPAAAAAGGGPPAVPGGGQPARPAVVRVGPGETLAGIARRLYGDERVADHIWQANRDRLRSPLLLVPGMELRLP